MQTPSAAHRQRSARAMRIGPPARASSRSSTAASTVRTAPITSAPAPARSTSTAVTDPVVPHDTAARQISARPRVRERGIGVSYGTVERHPLQQETTGMKIGFIGTGTMGQPMVANLVKKGFAVVAYDAVPAALAGAVKAGATAATSSAEAARAGEMVITMLPSSSHVEAVYLGAGGVLEGIAGGRLCVDMSTIDPSVSRRVAAALAAKKVRFLDAPVSGGVPRATDGTLAIMVGGDARDLEEARPALA